MTGRGRVDVHVHILPGVDDGPPDMAAGLALARGAVEDGTRRLVATPHVDCVEVLSIADRVAELQAALDAEGIVLDVLAGGELNVGDLWSLDASCLDALAQGPPDGRWILLEPPWRGAAEETLAGVAELAARGYGVVIAHPERSDPLWGPDPAIGRLAAAGARLQVTAGSLLPQAGQRVLDRAWSIVHGPHPALLASDAHDAVLRPPVLAFAAPLLAEAGVPVRRIGELLGGGRALTANPVRARHAIALP